MSGREAMARTFPQIPYGWADFEAMRLERCLYVDKTRFLHEMENERYAFLIRPRRPVRVSPVRPPCRRSQAASNTRPY